MASSDLAHARAQLSPAARAELMQRLRGGGAAATAIPRVAGATAPLSTSQERLWLIDQLLPGSAAYNIPVALRIRGTLDGAALKRSLDELVRRHAILRTVFEPATQATTEATADPAAGPAIAGCRQRVLPALAIALPVTDLRSLAPATRVAAEAEHIHAVCTQPFDLAHGPLLRARLLWLAPREHLLVLCFHHIACDGASAAVAVRELSALYQAFVLGQPSSLPPLAIQYADYAAWQRAETTRPAHAAALDRWQAALAGAPPWLELATDRPRTAQPALASSTASLVIPADVVARLQALGRGEAATPFMVLLAALQALLVRHTGQRDVVVGAPISTRSRPELEPLIGFFVNTLPLRARIAPGDSFRSVLCAVRATVLAAFADRDVPFEQIVERMGLRVEAGRVPLSEVMFAYEEPVAAPAGGGLGLALDWEEPDTGAVHIDLVLRARPVTGGLRITAIHRRALWSPERIAALLSHYRNLLAAIADAPDAPLGQLAILDDGERDRLLAWAAPAGPAAEPRCLHAMFEAAADRTPDACAVIAGDRQLSYAALDAAANQLAHALIAAGIGREQVVAVVAQRSERLAVALLAIWKAGGVYLPLDPGDPGDRLAQLITAARAALVLGDDTTPALDGVTAPRLRIDAAALHDQPRHRPARPALATDAAYVVYTSGSTGAAKGVVVEHAQLCNQTRWKLGACALSAADRLLHAIPHTFDPSIWDFIGPLACGASIIITPPGAHRDPVQLLALAARHRATVLDVSLAMLQAVLDAAEARPGAGLAVRHIFCGGDAMPPDVPARVHRTLGAQLFNQYGPTETTIDACFWRCDPAASGAVPIGRPVDGARVYLLDDAHQLVPPGAIGEICIAGAGVARGYLGDPERTAARFVIDPLTGGRMYCTGDLGRHRSDGAIEFLGRRDHQVKIRGVRVELGEIEARLAGHPAVREVVVVARRDAADAAARLVAYVVPHAGQAPHPRELRGFARAQLPDAMVPSAFVILPALPTSASGKLDRSALPAPAIERDAEYVAPRTATEQRIADILGEQLGIERVGAHDQFLELGGHSLMAMRVAARLSEATGARVPVRLVFEHPSVAELATAVDQLAGTTCDRAITARPPGTPAPLSHQQRFLWNLARTGHGALDCNVPLAVRFRGALDAGALAWAIGQLIVRHASLRTVFTGDGEHVVQRAVPPAGFALPRIDLAAAPDREVRLAELARTEACTAFDLRRDPLLRGSLVAVSPRDHALLLTTHRIAYDGASLRVLARELVAHYVARTTGVDPVVPALTVQYPDYAAWQHENAAAWAEDERYWLDQLADRASPAAVAAARLAPSAPGARCTRTLPAAIVAELAPFAAAHGATPFMVVLAAVHLALAATRGVADDPVDDAMWVPVANRGTRDVEPLIGRFVNLIALRTRLALDDLPRAALDRIRVTMLDALAHQQLPFERLITAATARGLALPRVMFNLVDAPLDHIELPGLQIAPLPVVEPSAEHELSITAELGRHALTLSAVFAADRHTADTTHLLLARIERALGGLISTSECALHDIVRRIREPEPLVEAQS
ncbi:MAG TPA: amino acid adenylation domain-containing protein [Kofleriaceae bacterium]|nr:amino acid adenylation domain-containing protein [Kofleriaceae bacterium]